MNDLIKFLTDNEYNYEVSHSNGNTKVTINIGEEPEQFVTKYDNIKDLRAATKMTQQGFGDYFGIPRRVIQSWELGERECKNYIINLLDYKLRKDGVIK
ncbi:DNA-binding transcriptional regulator [uncultured Eubacterium sp.]|uniref:helix-turn-helix domain-containing protein n=1 Tax=uncultured Eubacterium sp. TaxID=165185 RepID=UPI0026192C22|nr:hypothetical protein [uncultured Eubacterium sp.]